MLSYEDRNGRWQKQQQQNVVYMVGRHARRKLKIKKRTRETKKYVKDDAHVNEYKIILTIYPFPELHRLLACLWVENER